jgi:hypothetical protein
MGFEPTASSLGTSHGLRSQAGHENHGVGSHLDAEYRLRLKRGINSLRQGFSKEAWSSSGMGPVDTEIPLVEIGARGTRSPACDSDSPPPRRGRLLVDQVRPANRDALLLLVSPDSLVYLVSDSELLVMPQKQVLIVWLTTNGIMSFGTSQASIEFQLPYQALF